MPTPKPAEADADTHREEDEDEHQDQDVAAIPDDAHPRDGDGGIGGGGDDGATPGAGGSLSGLITSKRFLMLLAAVAAAFVAYRYYQANDGFGGVTDTIDRGTSDEEEEEEDPMPNIPQDKEDPLRADDEAFKWVFGDQPQAESDHPLE